LLAHKAGRETSIQRWGTQFNSKILIGGCHDRSELKTFIL
jgi:hypothetical protein